MVLRQDPRLTDQFLRGASLSWKRAKAPNENFGASKGYLGPNFRNLAPKGPTWQPCTQPSLHQSPGEHAQVI